MPRSKVPRKILFRDFAKQEKAYINKNYLKNFKKVRLKYSEAIGMDFSKIEFLLWAYDLQFFTIKYASKDFDSLTSKSLLAYLIVKNCRS